MLFLLFQNIYCNSQEFPVEKRKVTLKITDNSGKGGLSIVDGKFKMSNLSNTGDAIVTGDNKNFIITINGKAMCLDDEKPVVCGNKKFEVKSWQIKKFGNYFYVKPNKNKILSTSWNQKCLTYDSKGKLKVKSCKKPNYENQLFDFSDLANFKDKLGISNPEDNLNSGMSGNSGISGNSGMSGNSGISGSSGNSGSSGINTNTEINENSGMSGSSGMIGGNSGMIRSSGNSGNNENTGSNGYSRNYDAGNISGSNSDDEKSSSSSAKQEQKSAGYISNQNSNDTVAEYYTNYYKQHPEYAANYYKQQPGYDANYYQQPEYDANYYQQPGYAANYYSSNPNYYSEYYNVPCNDPHVNYYNTQYAKPNVSSSSSYSKVGEPNVYKTSSASQQAVLGTTPPINNATQVPTYTSPIYSYPYPYAYYNDQYLQQMSNQYHPSQQACYKKESQSIVKIPEFGDHNGITSSGNKPMRC
ncbi:hypothetical protein DMUE_1092 [Dictyocoela muelleri]|nr:hypothetical protein DMUE_1092 [Dictyocoela muelleri]